MQAFCLHPKSSIRQPRLLRNRTNRVSRVISRIVKAETAATCHQDIVCRAGLLTRKCRCCPIAAIRAEVAARCCTHIVTYCRHKDLCPVDFRGNLKARSRLIVCPHKSTICNKFLHLLLCRNTPSCTPLLTSNIVSRITRDIIADIQQALDQI